MEVVLLCTGAGWSGVEWRRQNTGAKVEVEGGGPAAWLFPRVPITGGQGGRLPPPFLSELHLLGFLHMSTSPPRRTQRQEDAGSVGGEGVEAVLSAAACGWGKQEEERGDAREERHAGRGQQKTSPPPHEQQQGADLRVPPPQPHEKKKTYVKFSKEERDILEREFASNPFPDRKVGVKSWCE